MRRQLPNGTYKWLGRGRGVPRGQAIGATPAKHGFVNYGRKAPVAAFQR